ncbi:MAG: heparinase II/III family protein [Acidobacteriota bacterium]
MRLIRFACLLAFASAFLPALHAATPIVERGGYFTTAQDLARLRSQASDPRLHLAYQQIKTESADAVARWNRLFPATQPAPSTDAIMAFGQASADRDLHYNALAIQTALDPSPANKRVLREMMLADLGWRQKKNYWHGMGIHDGEATTGFIEAYDIGAQFNVFTAADHAAVRDVMHQAGHFFELWLLDNPYSFGYDDKREQDFCLNFHVFSASTLSWIAMLYPDFPESKGWLRQSESQLVEYLMNGYGEDGAYSEGSTHYWSLSTRAFFNFAIVNKNLGVADYLAIPAISDRLHDTLHWRLHLTTPDGHVFAVGDADRNNDAHTVLETGGALLSDPELTWTAAMMFDRAEHGSWADTNATYLAHIDLSQPTRQPTQLSALFPLSGYAAFRSGWDDHADALFFKFGSSFIGRREAQRGPVISGHAHEDALELELHYNGQPVIADPGRHGRYEDWSVYGGFSKATVGHSTIGLGNPWGYNRLDGQYKKHQADHGADFTYERTQQNIDPADSQLHAFADLGAVAYSSARVRTYDAVQHQRSLIWFSADSLTIVADHLDSAQPQPYEWYLTPVGTPLGKDGALIFGDNVAKVQVLPILPAGERITTVSKSTANIPPYYAGFDADAPFQHPTDRWATFSLLILQKQAATTDFLNVLMPFSTATNPWKMESLSSTSQRLTLNNKQVLVTGTSTTGALTTNGQCGVLSSSSGHNESFALIEGTSLSQDNHPLITTKLATPVWGDRYPATVNALVSLTDKRASFDLTPWPLDTTLLLNPPRAVPGEEPTAPLFVSISFHVDAAPTKMLVLHAYSGKLEFNDPDWDKQMAWPRDRHVPYYKRQPLAFTYDAATSTVTIQLEPGEHQVVWQ